jgi:hypothetical protein
MPRRHPGENADGDYGARQRTPPLRRGGSCLEPLFCVVHEGATSLRGAPKKCAGLSGNRPARHRATVHILPGVLSI